jgi:hypothetical protein
MHQNFYSMRIFPNLFAGDDVDHKLGDCLSLSHSFQFLVNLPDERMYNMSPTASLNKPQTNLYQIVYNWLTMYVCFSWHAD